MFTVAFTKNNDINTAQFVTRAKSKELFTTEDRKLADALGNTLGSFKEISKVVVIAIATKQDPIISNPQMLFK